MSEAAAERVRILLVEDNPGDAVLLTELLAEVGKNSFDVIRESTLEAALQRLKNEEFAAVILDLALPDSSGMETVDRTHNQVSATRVPIIVLTGVTDESEGITAVQHGAQDFLVKNDLQASKLIHSVQYAIERHRARQKQEDDEALEHHEREVESLESISSTSTTLVTARAYGMDRLKEASPDSFAALVEQYKQLIELAIEQRAFKVDRKTTQDLRVMAQRLGFMRAHPRDVVDIHVAAMRKEAVGAKLRRHYVLAEESRMLLTELMGYLASYYRDHMVPIRHHGVSPTKVESR